MEIALEMRGVAVVGIILLEVMDPRQVQSCDQHMTSCDCHMTPMPCLGGLLHHAKGPWCTLYVCVRL